MSQQSDNAKFDRLSRLPGLVKQPEFGSPQHEQLERELEFAIDCVDPDNSKVGRERTARAILKMMVSRGYWPLGTRCEVTKKFKVKTVFPGAS